MLIYLSDKVISVISLIILSPLLLFISILIYFDLGRPIFFTQKRVGLHGRVFKIYKFRTMKKSNHRKVLQAHEEHERITKVGAIFRSSRLDELPQLLNVIKGDMSIVGPRPHEESQDKHFCNEIINYKLRHMVKPGLTGFAQVNGFTGPITDNQMIMKRIDYDLIWVRERNIFLYYIIILRTFKFYLWIDK